MRVFTSIGLKLKAPRDLGILFRKLSGHLADELQFPLVIGQQFLSHTPPVTAIRRESRCTVASKTTGFPPPVRSTAEICSLRKGRCGSAPSMATETRSS